MLRILLAAIVLCASCKKPPTPVEPPGEQSYVWRVDTLFYDLPQLPPDQVGVQCIWGSSSHDVWATAYSDIPSGELWHYNGRRWNPVHGWPLNGIDSGGSFINDVLAVTGFDSNNVFVFGFHGYDTSGTDLVLKWNGSTWSTLPWVMGKAPRGGLGWGVKQFNNKLWAVGSRGEVIKYENGFLSSEPKFTDFRLTTPVIGALDNGEVYVNAFKDSLVGDSLKGSITKLYKRDLSGRWDLIENKFISGDYYDGDGLGRGLAGVGNHLYTHNYGYWERTGSSWVRRLTIYGVGGECLVTENDMWVYYRQELWHFDGVHWLLVPIPAIASYQGSYLYGQGWSDGTEIFLSLRHGSNTFILHGRK